MRFTGRPLGAGRLAGTRQTALQQVQFFNDSPDLVIVRWYAVPADRPILPYPSIFAAGSLDNDVPWREGMEAGKLPGQQGMQGVPQPYIWAPPTDRFNPRHFCGAPAQWAGALSVHNPADLGGVDCCFVDNFDLPGRADLALSASAAWSFGLSYAGRAGLVITPDATVFSNDRFPGRAGLVITPAAAWTYAPNYAGAAPLSLFAFSAIADARSYPGLAPLALSASSTSSPGVPYAGLAPLALSASSTSSPGVPYAGLAPLALSASSIVFPGVSYSGDALLQMTARSTITPGFTLAGKASLSISAKSGLIRDVTTCAQCAHTTYWFLLTMSGGTGAWAAVNGTALLQYANSGCLWTGSHSGGFSITMQFISGAWLLEISGNAPLSDARYAPTGSFACLGVTNWHLTSSFGTGTPPTCAISVFYDSR